MKKSSKAANLLLNTSGCLNVVPETPPNSFFHELSCNFCSWTENTGGKKKKICSTKTPYTKLNFSSAFVICHRKKHLGFLVSIPTTPRKLREM